jgi:diguanylate cyclase (GGDEF)-like protein
MQPKHLPARKGTYFKRLIVAGGVVTAAFLAICVMVLIEMGHRDYEKARQAAANVIATIDSEIARNLELYDLSLQAVVDGMKLPKVLRADPELRQLILFDRAATAKHMGSIFVLDRNGMLVADSRTLKMKPENHSGKEYFQVYQKGSILENYISHPWVDRNGEYQISISRRMSGADNSFQGVVVGTLKLSYFHDLFRKLKLSDGDVLFLVSTDGTMIMRTPFDIDFIGRDVSKTAISQQMSQAEAGSYDAVAGIDGIKRLYVYQRIGKHPLRIGYGQSHNSIYAGWRHEAWRLGLMVFLVCAMNITLIVFLARTLKSRGRAEDALAVSSTTDSLTGLCNRRRFDEIFEQEWRRAQRTQSSIAMCMIDADEFKSYNDRFGHQAGDAALVAIADCIAMGARRGADFGARYGGEEFVVLLPGKSTEEAFEIAENIRSAILSLRAQEQGREDSLPTISSGVASLIPRQGLQMSSLLKAADMALYQAKSRGRNRTERAAGCHLVVSEEKRIAA